MEKRVVVIQIEHGHDRKEASKALDRVLADVVEYARQRAARFLCKCATVIVQETQEEN